MGQQYLAGALLNHFEGLHVQSFDLPTLWSDSARVSIPSSVLFSLANNAIVAGSYRSAAFHRSPTT